MTSDDTTAGNSEEAGGGASEDEDTGGPPRDPNTGKFLPKEEQVDDTAEPSDGETTEPEPFEQG